MTNTMRYAAIPKGFEVFNVVLLMLRPVDHTQIAACTDRVLCQAPGVPGAPDGGEPNYTLFVMRPEPVHNPFHDTISIHFSTDIVSVASVFSVSVNQREGHSL